MKALFSKHGPKRDYRGAHVALEYSGRTLFGEIKNVYRDNVRGVVLAEVRHFCGDSWPISPALITLEILER